MCKIESLVADGLTARLRQINPGYHPHEVLTSTGQKVAPFSLKVLPDLFLQSQRTGDKSTSYELVGGERRIMYGCLIPMVPASSQSSGWHALQGKEDGSELTSGELMSETRNGWRGIQE